MIILGIDPGSVVCGYGVIAAEGSAFRLIEYGVIRAKKKSELMDLRLREIFLRLENVIDRTQPEAAAFETMFYSKNAQSLMKLSHARGAAMLSASLHEIPVHEYSPREVKKAVTGRGNAGKEQVQFMVKKMLNLDETPEFYDVTDALAVAVCHSLRNHAGQSKPGSWKAFIKDNPDRIV